MKKHIAFSIVGLIVLTLTFQNCSDAAFSKKNLADDDLTPFVTTVGVVTILLALGDQLNDQVVVNGGSSQVIAETMVRFASPVLNPKILVVRDRGHMNESAYDSQFIAETLLARYDADFMDEPDGGLLAEHLEGYDLIWFNNPGYPMSQEQSKRSLMNFEGGIILSGDDMSRGTTFSLNDLTGLEYVDNGTVVTCDSQNYNHDNNAGYQFAVGISPTALPGYDTSVLEFSYGNDIDNTVASPRVEVIAYAVGGHQSCSAERPVVVRYEK